jgi:hypothetical protein
MRPALLVFVLSIVLLEVPGAHERVVAPYSGLETRNLLVQTVRSDGPNAASGIQPGDEVLAIDGERLRNHAQYQYLVASNRAFAAQDFEIRRDDVVLHSTVHYAKTPRATLLERVGLLLLALAFLSVGMWVYLRRPDTLGALFAANTSILAYFLTDRPASASAVLQLAGEIAGDAFVLVSCTSSCAFRTGVRAKACAARPPRGSTCPACCSPRSAHFSPCAASRSGRRTKPRKPFCSPRRRCTSPCT